MIKKIFHIFAIALSSVLVSCTEMTMFTGSYVAFDMERNTSTNIFCEANIESDYYIHLCSRSRQAPFSVTYSLKVGDGLVEGVDFVLVTKGRTISFYPGVYDKPITIKWLAHDINPTKDCTLTLVLENVSDDNVALGMPGPDGIAKTLLLTKYKL